MDNSRRSFLAIAGLAPLAIAAAARAQTNPPPAPAACFDPAALPLSQKNRRRSLGYVDPAPQPGRNCGACSFFTATQGGCGTCMILTGGTVGATAVCTSFAAKAG